MTPAPRPLDRFAVAMMLLLCGSWGLNQVAGKAALAEVGPLSQAGLRAAVGALMVAAYAWRFKPEIWRADGAELAGVLVGLMFAFEFIVLFVALQWTTAARASVFLYTAPFFVALGAMVLLPHERLRPIQWLGMALAFAGVAAGLYRPGPGASPIGDLLAILAGGVWGATTVAIKATALRRADAAKVLLYQVGAAGLTTPFVAWAAGERWPAHVLATTALCLAYQGVWVVGVTYLIWFWLLGRYRAGELSAFTFLTPIVGVLAGWSILGEALSPAFLAALALVAAGLAIVNWPRRPTVARAGPRDPE
jgi:drug/metabolite transporter (DMT)-like permease